MNTINFQQVTKPQRNYVKADFSPTDWSSIEPYYNDLLAREINSLADLKKWLKDWSELEGIIDEHSRWIYVKTTIDTSDESAKQNLQNYYANMFPLISSAENKIRKKIIDCPYSSELDEETFGVAIKKIKNENNLYVEENVALKSELTIKQSRYDELIGAQSIVYNGTEMTMQQAGIYMKDPNREVRKEVFEKSIERKEQDTEELDNLLSELIQLRHKIALNAGYSNYRDYRFAELARFDYTAEDCFNFHQAVAEVITPLQIKADELRKQKLGYGDLRPWDLEVDSSGKQVLKPFETGEELVNKTIDCFQQLDPYFANCLTTMQKLNFLDVESRMHKGPGGYNMTMPEIGIPFIFMNSTNSERDVITMVHEGGHAVHSFLAHNLELNIFKDTPSEIAEVASMGMELISMGNWDVFYKNPEDLKRAKKNHLENIASILSRTCLGDSFQHWMYLNPNHTIAERRAKWVELHKTYCGDVVNWNGYEQSFETFYHRVLHFFVVPFYYIEYAFAQLGALALWRNFNINPQQTIADYKTALKLGYTKPIPQFYKAAGIEFNFSKPYVAELGEFLEGELKKLRD
jgi:oligoendopeptidase F